MVLLSVCRTNTMGIRRFIQALEKDALIYEQQHFGSNASANGIYLVSSYSSIKFTLLTPSFSN